MLQFLSKIPINNGLRKSVISRPWWLSEYTFYFVIFSEEIAPENWEPLLYTKILIHKKKPIF